MQFTELYTNQTQCLGFFSGKSDIFFYRNGGFCSILMGPSEVGLWETLNFNAKCCVCRTLFFFLKEGSRTLLWVYILWRKMLKVTQVLLHTAFELMSQWMWLVGFNNLITEYLNCLFMIDDISACKVNVVKLPVSIAILVCD